MMSETELAKGSAVRRIGRIALRVAVVLLFAAAIGWVLNRISISMEHSTRPAGFARGMLQGMLMPMSLPNLLVGKDVVIYSVNNTGVSYKLGYTAGVNTAGAVFFGLFFWRVSRWRKGQQMQNEK
jgi:hypothetical protein